MVKPLLKPVTANKVQFVSLSEAQEFFSSHYDEETTTWIQQEIAVREDAAQNGDDGDDHETDAMTECSPLQENRGARANGKRYWEWRNEDGSLKFVKPHSFTPAP